MSGGDADADIGPALNAVIAEGHNLIAVGCTDEANLLKLRTHLETVGAPEEKRWALGIYGQNRCIGANNDTGRPSEQRLSVFGLVS